MQYSIDDLVRLAKRDNNNIRPYLYVNPIQGKHIPTDPEDTMMMCRTLANMVKAAYPSDKLFNNRICRNCNGNSCRRLSLFG